MMILRSTASTDFSITAPTNQAAKSLYSRSGSLRSCKPLANIKIGNLHGNTMRKILLISFLLTFFSNHSFAQCAVNEVEVKVEIATDNWGDETYWTLSDLVGTVILQGGQGGVYANDTMYSASTCAPEESCLVFEIYDTYGDGIYAPNGYELYVDNILISSGSNDIGFYATDTTNCPCLTFDALTDLQEHINGITPLTNQELLEIRDIFVEQPECLPKNEAMILLGKSVVEDYDNQIGALFTTPNTVNGFSRDPATTAGLEMEHAMIALQQGIFDHVLTPEVYALYPQHINGCIFNSCNSFPGFVAPPVDSTISYEVMIRANFEDPDGMNPYYDINGDGTEHALRPTGLYLAPGSVATITVPDSLVDKDYYIRVGAHEWDLSIRPTFKRLDRISKKFPIDSTTIEIFNPLGGAIAVLIPYGANEGIVEVSVNNALEAPFYSLKDFYETPDFNAELNKPGPWAVFETDNVMYTIPKHSIIPGQYDLMQTLKDWDAAAQGINSIMARQIIPDKHNIYMIADITIRYNSYSIGYPMSNTPLSFTNVPGPVYFIDGPGGVGAAPDANDETNFHEYGHSIAMSKFPGEAEALVNVPYIMALNYGLNQDLDIAVKNSFPPYTFVIDKTATHRMVSNSFGTERDITNSTTNEVRYQHRGYGHYFEIVNMLGWCPLRNFWKQELIDFENGIDYGINNQDIDSRILRISTAAEADLRPLFHVFGILPQDSSAVQDTLNLLNIEASLIVYNRLQDYFNLIPQDNASFINYALFVYPNIYVDGPTSDPDYGVGWHYQKSLTYNAAEALQRTNILQGIIDLYYPNGQPVGNGNPDLCCLLDIMNISMVSNDVVVTGGVEPYVISIDTTGSLQTVTVVDFDGCESTVVLTITSLSELVKDDLHVFPNPTTGEIQIDFGTRQDQLSISALDLSGKVIQTKTVTPDTHYSYQLPEAAGIYLLKITYSDGEYRCVRVIKQ